MVRAYKHRDLTEKHLGNFCPEALTGCWLWLGGEITGGYGVIQVRRRGQPTITHRAHRYFYEHLKGPIPTGLFVCHRCDNRLCVNPDHLFLGTNGDNIRDMRRKGRGRQVLTPSTVDASRIEYLAGYSCQDLALKHGVSVVTMHQALTGDTWNILTTEPPVSKPKHWVHRERQFVSKLTREAAQEIRARAAAGESTNSIALYFQVKAATVRSVLAYRTWAHSAEDLAYLEARKQRLSSNTCDVCGSVFASKTLRARRCSRKCNNVYWNQHFGSIAKQTQVSVESTDSKQVWPITRTDSEESAS